MDNARSGEKSGSSMTIFSYPPHGLGSRGMFNYSIDPSFPHAPILPQRSDSAPTILVTNEDGSVVSCSTFPEVMTRYVIFEDVIEQVGASLLRQDRRNMETTRVIAEQAIATAVEARGIIPTTAEAAWLISRLLDRKISASAIVLPYELGVTAQKLPTILFIELEGVLLTDSVNAYHNMLSELRLRKFATKDRLLVHMLFDSGRARNLRKLHEIVSPSYVILNTANLPFPKNVLTKILRVAGLDFIAENLFKEPSLMLKHDRPFMPPEWLKGHETGQMNWLALISEDSQISDEDNVQARTIRCVPARGFGQSEFDHMLAVFNSGVEESDDNNISRF